MGDERQHPILWVAITASIAQTVFAWIGYPDFDLNQGGYLLLAFVAVLATPLDIGAMVAFGMRKTPDLVTAAFAGVFLLWHCLGVVLLSGLAGRWLMELFMYVLGDKTFSLWYQMAQVVVFAVVFLVSIFTHARQPVGPRRPARMRAPQLPGA